jgi:hypothetical protein
LFNDTTKNGNDRTNIPFSILMTLFETKVVCQLPLILLSGFLPMNFLCTVKMPKCCRAIKWLVIAENTNGIACRCDHQLNEIEQVQKASL